MKNKIVITVVGNDRTGIVANVSTKISELNMNIIDISQKILESNIFAMIMLVEADKNIDIQFLQNEFHKLEEKIGVKIFLQHEEIFRTMHRI
ncbi:MAG: ACT domain-containing protein [Fusobacterium sp.]|uniref:ACT domain-containing protein n=1 Tax=Fusobacterium sp. TaxID=68766 RepID=UPI0026DD2C10|nr:ACT domain-containing protein [Fusobacterium sp.]MDO4691179.1 ACT domain-containing protein [Fusobacterium sp.]